MSRRVLVSLAFCVFIAASLRAEIAVSIEGRAVTAQGLTPGAGAVFFSIAHEPHLAHFSIKRLAQYVPDEDADGIVSYTAEAAVPWKSIWFVVDARTGRYAKASPEDFPDRLSDDRPSRVTRDGTGGWTRLSHERPWLELLVIRPGGDVWNLTAMRGGWADVNKNDDAEWVTPVSLFQAVTPATGPLERLRGGDIVIAIDPHSVHYFYAGVE